MPHSLLLSHDKFVLHKLGTPRICPEVQLKKKTRKNDPLTNSYRWPPRSGVRVERPSHLPPPDSDVHSDGDEDIQPGAPFYWSQVPPSTNLHLAREFQVQARSQTVPRTEKEIENEIDVEQLRASVLRPELLVRRCSHWNEVEGRAHRVARLVPSSPFVPCLSRWLNLTVK